MGGKIPEVTVVIPLYNKAPHIARAINSVLSQTFRDFEIIVVDDGSTDNGAEIVQGFGDIRIRLIRQENLGVSAARNRGIEDAKAELIAFLDADDEWLPRFIETILRLRTLFPDAGLYGTAYEVHFPGSIVHRVYCKNAGERILSSYFGELVKYGNLIFNSSSFAAPKQVFIRVGGYPKGVNWNEDGVLWGKIALQFSIAYSPQICSIYHRYSINSSIMNTTYVENPFLNYISTIPNDELCQRADIEALKEYCDLTRLATISHNIYCGHGKRARLELLSVSSSRFAREKYKLNFFSFIPLSIMRLIRNNAATVSFFKRKLIRSKK